MVRLLSRILIAYQMVTSGNGNNHYSIRKIYIESLESCEIWKQYEGCFIKSKTTKNEINDSKDIKDIPNTSYSKTKSHHDNDKNIFMSIPEKLFLKSEISVTVWTFPFSLILYQIFPFEIKYVFINFFSQSFLHLLDSIL